VFSLSLYRMSFLIYVHTSDAVAASGHVVEPAKVHRGEGPGGRGGVREGKRERKRRREGGRKETGRESDREREREREKRFREGQSTLLQWARRSQTC